MNPNFDDLLKVLNREQPKKVPLYEHMVDFLIMEQILKKKLPHIGRMLSNFENKEKFMKYLVEFYGGMGYDYVPIELGLNFPRKNVIKGTYDEPLENQWRFWIDDQSSTIANQEEFDEFPWPEPENAIDFQMYKALAKVLPKNMKLVSGVGGGVFEYVVQLVGMVAMSKSLRWDPKFIENMFNKIGSLIESVDKIIVEEEIVGIMRMGDDMGFKGGTTISPNDLRKYVFPWHKKIVEVAHKNGMPFLLHSCGNLSKVMEDLIEDVKIDGWHSFQDNIIPVIEAKEKFGHRVAILGGVDVDVISREDVSTVKEYSRNILQKCKVGGGYAFGSGNSIPNYVKVENYLGMIDVWKKYGTY